MVEDRTRKGGSAHPRMPWIVMIGILCVLAVEGVNKSLFKTCEQSNFCQRLRKEGGEGYPSSWSVVSGSAGLTDGGYAWTARLSPAADGNDEWTAEDAELLVTLQAVDGGRVLRLLVEEDGNDRRFRVPSVVLPTALAERAEFHERDSADSASVSYTFGPQFRVDVDFSPFRVRIYDESSGTLVMAWNQRDRLRFETLADVPDPMPTDGSWVETFGGFRDSKPHGPQAISLDVAYPSATHVYGIAEHADHLALRDTHKQEPAVDPYRLFNLDVFEYETDSTMALYGAVPLMWAHSADGPTVALLWLNAAETWVDVGTTAHGKKGKEAYWMSETGEMEVYALLGPGVTDVFGQYGRLTGYTPLPQRFALGYHQCRWNYNDESDVAAVDGGFDAHGIPYDVLWLDIEHTDGKRYFTWDDAKFPDPAAMQQRLAAVGRRMVTIVDPHIKADANYRIYRDALEQGFFVRQRDGQVYQGQCWPGASSYLDFLNPAVTEWWAEQFALDVYEGSTESLYTWNDMNEPSVFSGPEVSMDRDCLHHGDVEHRALHNLYGMLYHRASVLGQTRRHKHENDRPFVLTRAFFAGTQRYGPVWTGDNAAKPDHLRFSTPMLLSLGLCGISFSGADVGGFFGNPEPELLVRWYQAAALQPFFRGHAHIETRRREPWVHGEPHTSRIRDAIRLRYSLLPYVYTVFADGERSGVPALRPLWVEFPREPELLEVDDQFLLGGAVLAKPLLSTEVPTASLVLPVGARWVRYDEAHPQYGTWLPKGTRSVRLDVGPDSIPMLLRGGRVVPRAPRVRRSSDLMAADPLALHVALDDLGQAQGELYLDDGRSYNYTRGDYVRLRFEAAGRTLQRTAREGLADAPNRLQEVRVFGLPEAPSTVSVRCSELDVERPLDFTWNSSNHLLIIRKPWCLIQDSWRIQF